MKFDFVETYGFKEGQIVRALTARDGLPIGSAVQNRADEQVPGSSAWWQSFLRGGQVFTDARAQERPVIRSVDVFCGCGGLTLGAMQASLGMGRRFESVAAIDVDDEGLEVHRANFGTKHVLHANASSLVDWHVSGDGVQAEFAYEPEIVDPVLAEEVGKIDLLLAGPPCQGHSNLNNRTRREDPRNLLYITAVALGAALRARAIVIENVPDVVNDRSDVVATARALLAASGYKWIDSGVLATDRLGGAQTRKRYFLVATLDDADGAADIKHIAQRLKQPPRPLSWAISDLLDRENEGPHVGIMDTVPAMSAENAIRIKHLFDNDLHILPNEVRPDSHKNGHTYPSVYGRLWWDKPAGTVTTGFLTPGRGRHIHPLKPRVITPREAARIQSFPDTFSFVVNPEVPPSRAALQKWIGDAVPPLLGYAATLPVILRL
ncbi:DNA cytosine methyltransferase [Ramlibacter sp. AN1133]|uniref:DNA cytosine methyltransferase n=1 Tax=Ramlibacter sp. AN1133 TaxID=3133429 RepID=UPI0030C4669F